MAIEHSRMGQRWRSESSPPQGLARSRTSPDRTNRGCNEAKRDARAKRRNDDSDRGSRVSLRGREDDGSKEDERMRGREEQRTKGEERKVEGRREDPQGKGVRDLNVRPPPRREDIVKKEDNSLEERKQLEESFRGEKKRSPTLTSLERKGYRINKEGKWEPQCHRCGEWGHSNFQCKNDWLCYQCRKSDHISKDCPMLGKVPEKEPIAAKSILAVLQKAEPQPIVRAYINPTLLMAEIEHRMGRCVILIARLGNLSLAAVTNAIQESLPPTTGWEWQVESFGDKSFMVN